MWNKNKVDLLRILIKSDVTSIEELSHALGLKKRTIYFYIKEINDLLKKHKLTQIKNKRNKGFVFDGDYDLFQKIVEDEFYLFSHKERIAFMCFDSLVNFTSKKSLSDYTELFGVSKNTIFIDVQEGPKLMAQYNLKFSFGKNKSIYIDGEEDQKRSFLIHYINDFIINNEDFIVQKLFKVREIRNTEIIETIKVIIESFKEFNLFINDRYFKFLSTYLSILKIYYRSNKTFIKIPEAILNFTKKTPYFEKCQELFNIFYGDENLIDEKCYLVLLMTSGLLSDTSEVCQNSFLDSKKKFVKDLSETVSMFVNSVENSSLIFLNNKEKLIQNLVAHILRSYLRIKYVLVGTEHVKVKEEYCYMFDFVNQNISIIEKLLNVKMFDDDIALISIHFISDLFTTNNFKIKTAIILPPHHDIETIIEKQLDSLFTNLDIFKVNNLADFVEHDESEFDLILSTIDLPKHVNYLKIGKILLDDEKKEINSKIQKIVESKTLNVVDYKKMLDPDCFSILEDQISDFKDGVNKFCQTLLRKKKIDSKFIDSIIDNFNKHGQVHKLTKNALMIYGPFDNKRNILSYGFNFLRKSSNFYFDKNRIDFVIVLVPVNGNIHLHSLKAIREIVSNKKLLDQANKCKNVQDLVDLVLNYNAVFTQNPK